MSYPAPRYNGDTGEASATFRPDGQPSELPHAAYLATGASTDGRFGLYRWRMGPRAGGPAPHFHRSISEAFYVLSGTVHLYDGSAWTDATTGDFLYVPEGGIHGFRNESDDVASMLVLFAPGAPREEYFETLARGDRMTAEERAAFMVRHDTFWR